MSRELDSLLAEMKSVHEDLKPISTDIIVVADWVRLKCQYGCKSYGNHLCCPPFAPKPQETKAVLSEYRQAALVRFEAKPDPKLQAKGPSRALGGSVTRLHKTIFELERTAFLAGYYKAFGMSAMPCNLCESCIIDEMLKKDQAVFELDMLRCRHKDIMRPSMEACGIDVFQTLKNAGYSPKVIKDYSAKVELFGLLLLE